ncbi:MAG TPA: M64 family metallopeptidase, partial [Steroidobacteraceae bacterium]
VARGSRKYYQEGLFPNVTTATDPGLIPWRHWFADAKRIPVDPDENGVGRFEGAYYMPIGFYRPKRDSFMRHLDAPIGEVNAEAWLRALYRALPPLRASLPAHRTVIGLPGETLDFRIASEWPAKIMAVRWYIDGVEAEGARDAWRYGLQADGLTHEVRVSIEDRTGLIRDPDANEHKGSAVWTVSDDHRPMRMAKASQGHRISGWVRMRVDSTGHTVVGVTQTEARSLHRLGTAADSGFESTLFDAEGALLSRQRIADPRMVRGPLPGRGMAAAGHGIATLESGYYLIEIPEGADARKLRIRAVTGAEKTEPMTEGSPTELWLDL